MRRINDTEIKSGLIWDTEHRYSGILMNEIEKLEFEKKVKENQTGFDLNLLVRHDWSCFRNTDKYKELQVLTSNQ
jgi:hypothetical protein